MPEPIEVDSLIFARWILPIRPERKVYENCALAIKNGEILSITPKQEASKRYRCSAPYYLDHHVVMPGLVNAHGHAAMSLLKGYADDLPLESWLNNHIWPTEKQWVCPQFVSEGTELAVAEMLACGTTCFSDMYFFPEETAKVALSAGIRAQITFPILDFPTAWANSADEHIHKGLALHDQYRSNDLISIGFGPHAPYTVSDAPLKRIATLAEELQAPVQIHLHETAQEVQAAIEKTGVRPIERLNALGVLSPLTQCVHMTQLTEQDIKTVAASGASVIHCPQSNLKLASGLCPVSDLLNAQISVGIGTDGAASNNALNMLYELNSAALVAKIQTANAAAIDAHQALNMATLMGAKAIGMDQQIGSLEPGKRADVIAVSLDTIGAHPVYNVASQLVYNTPNIQVTHTWVDGHCLYKDGDLTTLSRASVIQKAQSWQTKINTQT